MATWWPARRTRSTRGPRREEARPVTNAHRVLPAETHGAHRRFEEIVVEELAAVSPPSESRPVPTPADGVVTAVTLGTWLRSERLARRRTVTEMARRLFQAGRARGDGAVASAQSLNSYVRRWESDQCATSRRCRVHYCAALGIDFRRFGLASASHAEESNSAASEFPCPYVDETAGYMVKIPRGCREIVIQVYPLFAAVAGRDDAESRSGDQVNDRR